MTFVTISNKLFGYFFFFSPDHFVLLIKSSTSPLTSVLYHLLLKLTIWLVINYKNSLSSVSDRSEWLDDERGPRLPFSWRETRLLQKYLLLKVEIGSLALLDVHLKLWFRALGETSLDAQSLVEREAKTEKVSLLFCFVVLCAYFYHIGFVTQYQENKLLAKNLTSSNNRWHKPGDR